MRKFSTLFVIVAVVVALRAIAMAAATAYVPGTSYGRQATSVTSSTVPVNVMASAVRGTYRLCAQSTCANPLLCGDYAGTIPGSVPPNWEEIPAGQCKPDTGVDSLGPTPSTLNLAWGCVLSTGSTACNAYATWR